MRVMSDGIWPALDHHVDKLRPTENDLLDGAVDYLRY